jgi:hypothetical protein
MMAIKKIFGSAMQVILHLFLHLLPVKLCQILPRIATKMRKIRWTKIGLKPVDTQK